MNLTRLFLTVAGWFVRQKDGYEPQRNSPQPRILVIRRNRLGDMICTLPLLYALRRHYPKALLTVACDPTGEPIARACQAVNDVIVLEMVGNRWLGVLKNAKRLQGFDWVIAAKGGFDRRLAALACLTHGAIRIGFEKSKRKPSLYYTHPVAPPDDWQEHQIETLLRLLEPLGVVEITGHTVRLALDVPAEAKAFAQTVLTAPPFAQARRFVLINISSTVQVKFSLDDFMALAGRILAGTEWAIGWVSAPADQEKARELALRCPADRVAAVATSGPLELAALMERAVVLVTPEGGAAHLAAATGTPALVLWSEGPFHKWRSRGKNHIFVLPKPEEASLPIEQVWTALEPLLAGVPRPRYF